VETDAGTANNLPPVPDSLLAQISGAYLAQQSAEIAAAQASYTGSKTTPGQGNPFVRPTTPSGDVTAWVPGYGWETVPYADSYFAQEPAAIQQGTTSADTVGPASGTLSVANLRVQAQYDADVYHQSYTLYEVPADENGGQADYVIVPSSEPPTDVNEHFTHPTTLFVAKPSAIPGLPIQTQTPLGHGLGTHPTLASIPSGLIPDVTTYAQQHDVMGGTNPGITIPAGTGVPPGSGNPGLDSWQLAQLVQQEMEQSTGQPYLLLGEETSGGATYYRVMPQADLSNPNVNVGFTVTSSGSLSNTIAYGAIGSAGTNTAGRNAVGLAIEGAQAAASATNLAEPVTVYVANGEVQWVMAPRPVPAGATILYTTTSGMTAAGSAIYAANTGAEPAYTGPVTSATVSAAAASASAQSALLTAVLGTTIPTGYTGYVHVDLGGANWTDVYVSDGQYQGQSLPQSANAVGSVQYGVWVPGATASTSSPGPTSTVTTSARIPLTGSSGAVTNPIKTVPITGTSGGVLIGGATSSAATTAPADFTPSEAATYIHNFQALHPSEDFTPQYLAYISGSLLTEPYFAPDLAKNVP